MPPVCNFQQRLPPSDRGRSMSASQGSARAVEVRRRREPKSAPVVYAALLSKVAEAFRARMPLSERGKDGLAYPNAFDGAEAVDKICFIIKTTDRSLALLLGRALDAQKFFHDVTYDHRLRDNPNEIYQFRARLPSAFASGADGPGVPGGEPMGGSGLSSSGSRSSRPMSTESAASSTATSRAPSSRDTHTQSIVSNGSSATSITTHAQGLSQATVTGPASPGAGAAGVGGEDELPTGVFTMLTECYSSTCSAMQLCYSVTCPRRMEQQARHNTKPQRELKHQISQESIGEGSGPDAGTLWIHSVPKEVADALSDTEKRRQEAINEVIYTERDFVRDMEYLKEVCASRLCWLRLTIGFSVFFGCRSGSNVYKTPISSPPRKNGTTLSRRCSGICRRSSTPTPASGTRSPSDKNSLRSSARLAISWRTTCRSLSLSLIMVRTSCTASTSLRRRRVRTPRLRLSSRCVALDCWIVDVY